MRAAPGCEGAALLGLHFRKKKPKPAIWDRLSEIITQLRIHQDKLNARAGSMNARARELFDLTVRSKQENDEARATTYANELVQLRKMIHSTLRSQASLEGVTLRLEAAKDFGEVRQAIRPISNVIAMIQQDIRGVVPEVSSGLRGIQDLLDSLGMEVGTVSETFVDYRAADGEAEQILREAAEVASQRMKKTLPEVGEGQGFVG